MSLEQLARIGFHVAIGKVKIGSKVMLERTQWHGNSICTSIK